MAFRCEPVYWRADTKKNIDLAVIGKFLEGLPGVEDLRKHYKVKAWMH